MPTSLFKLIIIVASAMTITACGSSGWGMRGQQQSGGTQTPGSAQQSGGTHTLTGGAEAAPTSEATPKPAGPKGSAGSTGAGSTGDTGSDGSTGGSAQRTQ